MNCSRARYFMALSATSLWLLGCNGSVAPEDTVAVTAQAVTAPSMQTVTLPFYPGTDLKNTALLAASTLRIADNVKVVEATNASKFAPIENTGTANTEIGAYAKVGNLVSAANVWLRSGATVYGDVRTAGKLDRQSGADATGTKEQYANLGQLRNYRMTVKLPAATTSIELEPEQKATMTAGVGYATVSLKRASQVSLTSGTYYADALRLQSESILKVDTRKGPVVLWVKNELDYKGTVSITGPEGAFLIGYLGTMQTSLEKPIAATVLAPNANLRLAPVGNPGWKGSFFAKSIDAVEANSTITHRAFDYWDQLLDLKPILHCVRRFGSTGAALYGYENRSDFVATVPIGPNNALTPLSSMQPPTAFQPGVQNRQFWAPFDLAKGIAWTLAGTEAKVSSSVPDCQLGEAPAADLASDDGTIEIIHAPDPLPPRLEAIRLPDRMPTSVSGVAAVPRPAGAPSTGGGTVAVATMPLEGDAPEQVPFTFTIPVAIYSGSEGLCGAIDLYANITIDGERFGNTWSATKLIPSDKETVHVTAEIMDRDGFLCGGDDHIATHNFDINTYSDASGTSSDGKVGWTATPTRQPKICIHWNAQFMDSGPWTNSVGVAVSEGFAVGRDRIHKIPASFSCADLKVDDDSGTLYDRWAGALDKDGCFPESAMPPRSVWKTGNGLKVTTRLYSRHSLDSTGQGCWADSGVIVTTTLPNQNKIAVQCQVFAEDPGSVTEPDCAIQKISWMEVPPLPLTPDFDTPHSSHTRAAAAVSHILKREVDTSGGLGMVLGMETRRFNNAGPLRIAVETYCNAGGMQTSCRTGNTLFLEPAGLRAADMTNFKYAIAHEIGHHVAAAGMGSLSVAYGSGPGVAGVDALCQCAHVATDEQGHCLQSLEMPGASQAEGFGSFFAAKVWNIDLGDSCVFTHAKNFLNTSCMPGVEDCERDPGGAGWLNHYPVPLSCREAFKWRNTHCLGSNPTSDLLAQGTELDWLEFYYAINNNKVESERFSMEDIFGAYDSACGNTSGGCKQAKVSWIGGATGGMTHKSLVDGVRAEFGTLSSRAAAFIRDGRGYGVSNEL